MWTATKSDKSYLRCDEKIRCEMLESFQISRLRGGPNEEDYKL